MLQTDFLDFESLLPKRRGRKCQGRVSGKEKFDFLDSRGVVMAGAAKFCGVSPSALTQWRIKGVPKSRMKRLQELVERIKNWEAKSGRKFPG